MGIKPATEMLEMELVQPWLQAKKERALKVKESKEESKGSSANLTKKSRVGWTTSKIVSIKLIEQFDKQYQIHRTV